MSPLQAALVPRAHGPIGQLLVQLAHEAVMADHASLFEGFLNDYIMLDCRLGSHPKLRARVYWRTDRGFRPFAATAHAEHDGWRDADSLLGLGAKWLEAGLRYDHPMQPDYSLLPDWPSREWVQVPIGGTGSEAAGLLLIDAERGVLAPAHVGSAKLLATVLWYLWVRVVCRDRIITPASVELGRALAWARHGTGLTQASLAERVGTSRIAVSRWEGGAQPPSQGPLLRWLRSLGIAASGKPVLVRSVDVTGSLLRVLREDPARLRTLSPAEFERFVAGRLERMGFDVTLTGKASAVDGGLDLVAAREVPGVGPFLLAGQIKHHRGGQKTGVEAVDRLLRWKDSLFRLGLLVTNTQFTRNARWAAKQDRARDFLRLRDLDDLKVWLEDNFWSEDDWLLVPDEIEVAPGIRIAIPKPRLSDWRVIWPDAGTKIMGRG